MKKYQLACVIGRFQPFHKGHLDLINRALETAEKVVILIGSAGQPRTIRNPFTYNERAGMIDESVQAPFGRFSSMPLHDTTYDLPDWQQRVQSAVSSMVIDPTDTKRMRQCSGKSSNETWNQSQHPA
jgi:bifunctional NMN adenylyltransferase/nudix hydrolase